MPVDLATLDLALITNSHVGMAVGNLLGAGGQKRVWRVRYQNADYVLKVYQDQPDTRSRAEREVEIARACTSPYLARVGPLPLTRLVVTPPHDAILYYLEELIDGTTVDQVAKPFATAELVRMGLCLADAVAELSPRYVHRDIKPSNVVRRTNGGYVLLDVGMALDLSGVSITATGLVVGTRGYHAPEQLVPTYKRNLDFRADLFVVGILLYECATRVHPFSNLHMPGDVNVNIYTPTIRPVDPKRFNNNMADDLRPIIGRLLAKPVHLRYGRFEQLKNDLRNVR